MSALVDTNVLVYRYDPRDSAKQRVARALLRKGLEQEVLRIPHQAIVEFVQAVTRPVGRGGAGLLTRAEALREADEVARGNVPDSVSHRIAAANRDTRSRDLSVGLVRRAPVGLCRALRPRWRSSPRTSPTGS